MPPTARLAKCEFCGSTLDIAAVGTYQFTSGWVKLRGGGGGHAVALPKRENRWAHKYCVENEIRSGQMSFIIGRR